MIDKDTNEWMNQMIYLKESIRSMNLNLRIIQTCWEAQDVDERPRLKQLDDGRAKEHALIVRVGSDDQNSLPSPAATNLLPHATVNLPIPTFHGQLFLSIPASENQVVAQARKLALLERLQGEQDEEEAAERGRADGQGVEHDRRVDRGHVRGEGPRTGRPVGDMKTCVDHEAR